MMPTVRMSQPKSSAIGRIVMLMFTRSCVCSEKRSGARAVNCARIRHDEE